MAAPPVGALARPSESWIGAERPLGARPHRLDIQALRGLAVSLVLLQHAEFGVRAGYLGVDVFFVISGFLITGIIARSIERGTFAFAAFYWRRAKRLLPAAYVTFAATALASPFFLSREEMVAFEHQMVGAITFLANIALLRQSGYFDGPAVHKPLLHVWSLSLEEQYYFLLPATLVFVRPRRWMLVAVTALVASVALCAIGSISFPAATFYLLPTRAWELGIGSIAALVASRDGVVRLARSVAPFAVPVLFLIPLFPLGTFHPGLDAALVCIATVAIVLGCHPRLNDNWVTRALAPIGDISYSLYLVHWPLIAFANNAWVGDSVYLPIVLRCGLVAASLGFGVALYRFVEVPVRAANIRRSPRALAGTLVVSIAIVLLTVLLTRASGGRSRYGDFRQPNFGMDEACEQKAPFQPLAPCQSAPDPSILVWGDSYAMHLVPGIVASSGGAGVVQATRSSCGPLLGVAPVYLGGSEINRAWADACVTFNEAVLAYAAATPSIRTVVLSSPFSQYVESAPGHRLLVSDRATSTLRDVDLATALTGLQRTVKALRSVGKHVIVVAPPPSSGFNIGACLERIGDGKVTLGAPADCEVDVTRYHRFHAPVLDFLARASMEMRLPVFRFDPFLCGDDSCRTHIEGTALYRDQGHLSRTGSTLLGTRLSLAERLQTEAR